MEEYRKLLRYVNPFLPPSESPFLNRVRRTIRLKHLTRRT